MVYVSAYNDWVTLDFSMGASELEPSLNTSLKQINKNTDTHTVMDVRDYKFAVCNLPQAM